MTIIRGGHVLFYALLLFAFFQKWLCRAIFGSLAIADFTSLSALFSFQKWSAEWMGVWLGNPPPPKKKSSTPPFSLSITLFVEGSTICGTCPGPSAFPYLWITQIYVALRYLASFLVTRIQRESAIKRRECPPLEFIKWSHGFYFISSSVRGTVWGCWCKEPSPTRYSTIFIQNILQTKIKSLNKTLICLQDPLIIKMIRNISQHDGVTKSLFVEFIGKKRLFFLVKQILF